MRVLSDERVAKGFADIVYGMMREQGGYVINNSFGGQMVAETDRGYNK